jgi:UDP-N-acetylmuramyl tripeptide synthase
VFTNPTGSNFTRGVVSALIPLVDSAGRIDADIAVLELDEAYAVHFVRRVKPRYAVLLNVMRDQLDRFGEIDNTANLLAHVAEATTGTLVLNREDRRIAALAQRTHAGTVQYFGLEPKLRSSFPTDDELHTQSGSGSGSGSEEHAAAVARVAPAAAPAPAAAAASMPPAPAATAPAAATPVPSEAAPRSADDFRTLPADVTLAGVHEHSADFILDGQNHSTSVRVSGIYNLFNAAAALCVVRAVIATAGALPSHQALASTTSEQLLKALSSVTPAFGRGENIDVNGTDVELVLVKNPAGFRLALASFDAQSADTMIAINDDYADGRDMSWLWDVDFGSLKARGVAMVSGVRSWDMALRLGYDDVAVAEVEPDLAQAVDAFVEINLGVHKRIYCTYTAMLGIRKHLAQLTTVSDVGV